MNKTRLPQLPPPSDPQFLDAVREVLDVGEGRRGDPLDRKLTLRDVVEGGVAQLKSNGEIGPVNRAGDDQIGGEGAPARMPPEPSKLKAEGAFTRVIITWGVPGYSNHSMSEVARAKTDDFSQSEIVGTTTGRVYTDVVGGGFQGYWWVRHVSTEGREGPWSGPVSAETPVDPEYMLDQLTGSIVGSTLYNEFKKEYGIENLEKQWSVKVGQTVDGQTIVGGIGLSSKGPDSDEPGTIAMGVMADRFWVAEPNTDYSEEDKVFPFIIDDGKVYINSAHIAEAAITSAQIGSVSTDKIIAGESKLDESYISIATIFDALIENSIQSDPYKAGETGWKIDENGFAEFNNVKMRGLIHNGALDDDGNPVEGSRYIDFREGSGTNGDFVLGDVEENNYVSFNYDEEYGRRILRVHGDIILQNYHPGQNRIHQNNTTRSNNLPYPVFDTAWRDGKSEVAAEMYQPDQELDTGGGWFGDDLTTAEFSAKEQMQNVRDEIVDELKNPTGEYGGSDNTQLLKSTQVARSGRIRVKAKVSRQLVATNRDEGYSGDFIIAPMAFIGIKDNSGNIRFYESNMLVFPEILNPGWDYVGHPGNQFGGYYGFLTDRGFNDPTINKDGPTANETVVIDDVFSVKKGEEIQVRCGRVTVFMSFVSASQMEFGYYESYLSYRNISSWGTFQQNRSKAVCHYIHLYNEFVPTEQSIR